MVGNDQDLGLSLSLCYPAENGAVSNASSLHLNIMTSSHSHFTIINNNSWSPAFTSPDRRKEACTGETRSVFKGFDVNCVPETADLQAEEEEGGVSSPNSTISSVSGKRTERETTAGSEDHDGERASDEEDARKKLRLSKDQSTVLEESFKDHNTLNPKQKMALAKRLGLRPRQVEVWFQNRRARTKLKQTEVDCEFLKRCCENLTEENRRLQKEVQELRALKLSPQLYTQMTPPTTLTMCPSCERMSLTVDSSSSSSHLPQPTGSTKQRPVPFNPWAAAATPRCRPLYALHSRS